MACPPRKDSVQPGIWPAEMTGNKLELTFSLQILHSFLSGGGYLPVNISRKFCEGLSSACLGYKLSTILNPWLKSPLEATWWHLGRGSTATGSKSRHTLSWDLQEPSNSVYTIWDGKWRDNKRINDTSVNPLLLWPPVLFLHPVVFILLSICSCVHHTLVKYQRDPIGHYGWGQRLCVQADLLDFQFYHLTSCVLGQVMWLL